MSNIVKYNDDKAVVCSQGNCVAVYGETARLVNLMVLIAVFIILGSLVTKALK